MKRLAFLTMLLALASVPAFASDHTVNANFDVACNYTLNHDSPFGGHCAVGLDFAALVTEHGGGEIATGTAPNPIFAYVVRCDKNPWSVDQIPLAPIYNDGGTRYTGELGTQIIGSHGPTPTVFLNRGALHTGLHISESYLELMVNNTLVRGVGSCSIKGADRH